MPTYQLQNLTVRHLRAPSAPALQTINLTIEQGEQLALIGPSGAGKTTLLATLSLSHKPAEGSFHAFGADPWALGEAARHRLRAQLFLAPQTPPLPPRQRVVTAVLAARLPQWSVWRALVSLFKPDDPQAAWQALSRFNLGDKLYSRVDRLSGGERQRCGLARLLLSPAKALLVDEPLSALDPALSELTLATLREEAAARNATLICSLHQVELALAHFPRIVALRNGRVEFDLPREQVTPQMIAALYQGEQPAVADDTPHEDDAMAVKLGVGACL
ncbi:ATP-binding cassette domain-containing protein [Pseudoduganella sp. FT25W]|uniref:ATP-binding cassette domain-containing protein n=1 Tax=Duganella alba TaxID=2666081 RepID=A0A6L5QN31_9BURK|nr:ATP-binding cassette domain-containing protein [Duganella alba]MRX11190.1 ATP-binding cassette domain-containing protein [Duganella alba]MRX19339.1 ATP-binding cassette domain-containing protein [Duganella alba]